MIFNFLPRLKMLWEAGLIIIDTKINEIRMDIISKVFFPPPTNERKQNDQDENKQELFEPIHLKIILKGVFSAYVLGLFSSILIFFTEIITFILTNYNKVIEVKQTKPSIEQFKYGKRRSTNHALFRDGSLHYDIFRAQQTFNKIIYV